MKIFVFERTNEQEMTFLVIDGTRDWLSKSSFFKKNIKVKGFWCPDYQPYATYATW